MFLFAAAGEIESWGARLGRGGSGGWHCQKSPSGAFKAARCILRRRTRESDGENTPRSPKTAASSSRKQWRSLNQITAIHKIKKRELDRE